MWDLPGPGLKPVSPAMAGGFSTTAPPGKSHLAYFYSPWKEYTLGSTSSQELFCGCCSCCAVFVGRVFNTFERDSTEASLKLDLKEGLDIERPGEDFPGSPVVGSPRSHCQGPGFSPWSGN